MAEVRFRDEVHHHQLELRILASVSSPRLLLRGVGVRIIIKFLPTLRTETTTKSSETNSLSSAPPRSHPHGASRRVILTASAVTFWTLAELTPCASSLSTRNGLHDHELFIDTLNFMYFPWLLHQG